MKVPGSIAVPAGSLRQSLVAGSAIEKASLTAWAKSRSFLKTWRGGPTRILRGDRHLTIGRCPSPVSAASTSPGASYTDDVEAPVLPLDHAWHRQRASLRGGGRLRPPPLVAAGLEIDLGVDGPQVRVGGLVVVFGHFPASLPDLVSLARARLHLNPEQAQELAPVLDTRLLALWAWLPGPRQDCYLELDHATGTVRAWLMGPEAGAIDPIDLEDPPGQIEAWFLDALVLNGAPAWGGSRGLERLVDRFGPRPLLVAAQVSEILDRPDPDPAEAFELAHSRWHRLTESDEVPWADLADQEHPFVAAQLGRLALRLGLPRAARALLSGAVDDPTLPPMAHFDLGQACELSHDLTGAEDAFVRYLGQRATDPDGWRRLMVCRLRQGRTEQAQECLQRFRAHGGDEVVLASQLIAQVFCHHLPGDQRARCAGWLVARIDPLREGLVDRIAASRFPGDEDLFRAACRALQRGFAAEWPLLTSVTEGGLATVLLTLPFLGPSRDGRDPAHDARLALVEYTDGVLQHLDPDGPGLDESVDERALAALVRLAKS